MLPSISWSCLNKCTSLLLLKKKNECQQGREPWNIQNYRHSLPFSESECAIPPSSQCYLLHSELYWAPLSLLQQREPTVPSSPVINHTQASSCLKEVLPSITVLFLFKHTSFLLLPPLLYTEPPRCLFLPELKWDCFPKCHQWPSSQPMRQPFSPTPFCLTSRNVR